MKTLQDLFLEELADIYDGEQRMCEALPDIIKAATCEQLQAVLQSHLHETAAQKVELEKVFECFGKEPYTQKSRAMAGLLHETEKLICHHDGCPSINAAIICSMQRIEHYEIVTYACLRAWSGLLQHLEAACLLDLILDEEKAADRKLNELSRNANRQALPSLETAGLATHS